MSGVEKHCEACGKLLPGSVRYCSRSCRAQMAAFEDFHTLGFILGIARWAGAPSQKEMLRRYLRDRMRRAVKRLSVTADGLAEVLIEIVEISDERESSARCRC